MYRVRLPSGDEKTYQSIDEMVWDVELGVITSRAEMYHAASKAWVSITRHPQLGSRFADVASSDEVSLDFDLLSDAEIESLAPRARELPAPPADLQVVADLAIEAAQSDTLVPGGAGDDDADRVEAIETIDRATLRDEAAAHNQPAMDMSPAPEPPPPPAAPVEKAEGLATAGEMLLAPPPPAQQDLQPLAEVPVYTEPPSPPATGGPAEPPRAKRLSPRERTPQPSSYLPEPSLDGDLAPLPEAGGETWSAEYKPLEWKPEPRFGGLLRIGGAVLAIAAVGALGLFGWERWHARNSGLDSAAAAMTDTVARQAVDSVSDSALAAALRTLAVAETAGMGAASGSPRPGQIITGPRPVGGLRPMTPSELRRSYAEAYANARAAMDSDLALAGVHRLFATARLSSRDSLRAGRRLVNSARNIVRVFHGEELRIERAFRDTVQYQTSKMGWSKAQVADWRSRATLKESYEGGQLSDSLLGQVDATYTLLLGRWGEYELRGNSIVFDDPRGADEYDRIARWLNRTIATLDTRNESAVAPTARRLVRSLEGTRPPTLQRTRIPD